MDFDLHYISKGEGTVLIFQHGLASNVQQTQALLGSVEGIQLISMDCRGHGKSPLPQDYIPSFSNYTNDLLRLMDTLQIEQAVFGGISMGSGISLHMAIHHPERVKGLLLVRPAWLDKANPDNLKILLDTIDFLDQEGGIAAFKQMPEFQQIQSHLPNAAASIAGVFSRDQQEATARILRDMITDAPFRQMKELTHIEKACLILANDEDPLHPFEMAEKIGNKIPASQLKKLTSRYIDDAKHRQEVQRYVSAFMAQY